MSYPENSSDTPDLLRANPSRIMPIRFPQPINRNVVTDTQVQQIKTASLSNVQISNLSGRSIVSGSSTPKAVTNIRVTKTPLANGQVQLKISFIRDTSDPTFQGVNIHLKQGNGLPFQIGSGTTSPVTVILPKTSAASAVIVQTAGNLGDSDIANSPGRFLNLL